MKRTILLLSAIVISSVAIAQVKTSVAAPSVRKAAVATAPAKAKAPQEVDSKMKFSKIEHNFGTIPEGPAVSVDFKFKNTSREPIILSHVQASCGCTTPNWSKDPILPGKTSKITATYNTKGRPGNFYKTITVKSNVGTKQLRIKGVVEKAPSSSVPASKSSIMKR